jgi:hypothetical protein
VNLRERALLVDALGSAIADGGMSLGQVPELLCKVLKDGVWREFETQLGKHVTYDRFEDFVTTPPLSGLGANIDIVKRIVADDPVAKDLLDEAMKKPTGGDRRSATIRFRTRSLIETSGPESNTSQRPDRKLRRLRKDFPDLHEQVLQGKMTINAAAVQAGIYPFQMTVNLNSAKSAATLVARASPAFLDELKRLLYYTGEDN